jgi:hypothetical protein
MTANDHGAACSNASAGAVPNPRTPMSVSCGRCSDLALHAIGVTDWIMSGYNSAWSHLSLGVQRSQ